MAKRPKDPKGSYAIGYRKPPQNSQFKKGSSGNPTGRPKGSKNLATIVLEESRQPVRVNGPHGARKVTKLEATVMQLSNKSAQGDLRASRELFALVQRAEEVTTAQPGSKGLPEADQRMIESIRKRLKEFAHEAAPTKEDQ